MNGGTVPSDAWIARHRDTSMNERETLAEALYADGELGPGYMFRDDCEHLASRFLASDWLRDHDAALVAQARSDALREAADEAQGRATEARSDALGQARGSWRDVTRWLRAAASSHPTGRRS